MKPRVKLPPLILEFVGGPLDGRIMLGRRQTIGIPYRFHMPSGRSYYESETPIRVDTNGVSLIHKYPGRR